MNNMERTFKAVLLGSTRKGAVLRMGYVEYHKNLLSGNDTRSEIFGACRFSIHPDKKQFRFYGSHDEYGEIKSREAFEKAVKNYKAEGKGSLGQYKLAQSLYSMGFIKNVEEDFSTWEFIPPESAV